VKVLLIQVDGSLPNLALMKLSSYHKKLGDKVYYSNLQLREKSLYKDCGIRKLKTDPCGEPDKIYVSVVFSWNNWVPKAIKSMYQDVDVVSGGYMYDPQTRLPDEVEHTCPAYSMYYIDYSMGFTSRGCNRQCEWCHVWRIEGSIKEWSPLEEFVRHRKVILLDNNFLQRPEWKKKLLKLISGRFKVCFSQGLDIRLINDKVAHLLTKLNFWNHNFTYRQLHFAWDNPKDEKQVIRGIETLKAHGISPKRLMFYVLCGYNTTFEEDLYRAEKLIELGCDPWIMLYDKYRIQHPTELRKLDRFINRRLYKRFKIDFKTYIKLGAPHERQLKKTYS